MAIIGKSDYEGFNFTVNIKKESETIYKKKLFYKNCNFNARKYNLITAN